MTPPCPHGASPCEACRNSHRARMRRAARHGEVPPREAAHPALAPWLDALALPDRPPRPGELGPKRPPLGDTGVMARNRRVVEVLRANPSLGTDAVAERLGMSQGAVQQVARRAGLQRPTWAWELPEGGPA